ncbi:MAG: GrdX family protein [Clostridia bacterium]|nr:GrdX family protein [Clostridia bacterium]MBQ6933302.1 GrdX family protein [Clostridia bacterium]MBQ7087594.1 GrdX family protein [Clostridia bacterium]MBQ7094021.1 GrdX family protein [Clostridia bacterium]
MAYNFKIMTNNELVFEKYGNEYEVDYKPGTYEELLLRVRTEVHNGAKLLTHPLSGSIKPNETPFKTVYLKKGKGPLHLDFDSVEMIENAIITAKKFKIRFPVMPDYIRADFALIDLSLMESALPAATQA